jgi:hypothetical protein
LCLLISGFLVAVLRWPKWSSARLMAAGAVVAIVVLVMAEGLQAYQTDRQQLSRASSYSQVGEQIITYLAPGATVLGSERWWWALHTWHYLSLTTIWSQSEAGSEWCQSPCYVIINNNVKGDIQSYPQTVQSGFWSYLKTCAAPLAGWTDVSYGPILIYRVADHCAL